MHIGEAASRIRQALRLRTGRSWTIRRHRMKGQHAIRVATGSRYGDPWKMKLEERRQLADLLMVNYRNIPETGLMLFEGDWYDYVLRAEQDIYGGLH